MENDDKMCSDYYIQIYLLKSYTKDVYSTYHTGTYRLYNIIGQTT